MLFVVTSSSTAIVIDAEPDAMPRSIAIPRPIPAWITNVGRLCCTPKFIRPLPASGVAIQLNGLSGAAETDQEVDRHRREGYLQPEVEADVGQLAEA